MEQQRDRGDDHRLALDTHTHATDNKEQQQQHLHHHQRWSTAGRVCRRSGGPPRCLWLTWNPTPTTSRLYARRRLAACCIFSLCVLLCFACCLLSHHQQGGALSTAAARIVVPSWAFMPFVLTRALALSTTAHCHPSPLSFNRRADGPCHDWLAERSKAEKEAMNPTGPLGMPAIMFRCSIPCCLSSLPVVNCTLTYHMRAFLASTCRWIKLLRADHKQHPWGGTGKNGEIEKFAITRLPFI